MKQSADILIERGITDVLGVERARRLAHQGNIGLPLAFVRSGVAEEADVASAVAEAHGLSLLLPNADGPEALEFPHGVNARFLRRHHAAILAATDQAWQVAVADPSEDVLAGLRFALDGEIESFVATFSRVEELQGPGEIEELLVAEGDDPLLRMIEGESDAPIIRLVQNLLANASLRRASDVHIEPTARHVMMRYRIDGRLVEAETHPLALAAPIASRVKVMASLDIAETRLPQDGRLRLNVRGREVDVRVSTSPTAFGESIVLRLLGRSELPLDLNLLGPRGRRQCGKCNRTH